MHRAGRKKEIDLRERPDPPESHVDLVGHDARPTVRGTAGGPAAEVTLTRAAVPRDRRVGPRETRPTTPFGRK